MMKTRRKRPSNGFIRRTITLPSSLFEFAVSRSQQPRHAGNMSGYIRDLVLDDASKNKVVLQ